jgi:hypothetical protein
MRFPQSFSRVRRCKHCEANQLPYDSSERLKHHTLNFIVKPGSKSSSPDQFYFRKQTRPAKVGFTPHIFIVEKLVSLPEDITKLYLVKIACGVIGCHTERTFSPTGEVEYSIYFQETYYTEDDLANIYYYKDSKYMLDSKELQQSWFASIKFPPLSPY